MGREECGVLNVSDVSNEAAMAASFDTSLTLRTPLPCHARTFTFFTPHIVYFPLFYALLELSLTLKQDVTHPC